MLGEERFKRIKITINKKKFLLYNPLHYIFIKELKNKTDIYNSIIYNNNIDYYIKLCA